jgi:glycosyltransferase involved in cell wall biosynthesis
MKPWHGVPTLLQALHMLGGRRSSFRLLLVGSGPELPQLLRQITQLELDDCVHLAGAQPHDEVPEMIQAMDVAVASYASEAECYFSPLKLFEYMAMARPVVAARIGQTCDVIEHGRTGWLYTPGDAAELSRLIHMLATEPQLCREVAAAARERVIARNTWRHNAQEVVRIAEHLIAERQPAPRARNPKGLRLSRNLVRAARP